MKRDCSIRDFFAQAVHIRLCDLCGFARVIIPDFDQKQI